MSASESSYLTLSQVAVRTGRHPELLRQWCAAGRVPCTRVGASWVMREQDLPLIAGIASRRGRARDVVSTPAPGVSRTIAAVFEDPTAATGAATALRERFNLAPDAVGTGSVDLPSVPALSLTVVAVTLTSTVAINARRVLSAFGGRIVADIEEVRSGVLEAEPGTDFVAAPQPA